jgi:hypothetical protein
MKMAYYIPLPGKKRKGRKKRKKLIVFISATEV